mgnify:CR=1 FL=1
MYFPKSQLKTNLHTKGGEFVVESTENSYTGPYFKTSTGDYYSGKNPQDYPVVKLSPTEVTDLNNGGDQQTTNSPESIWTWDYYGTPLDKSKPPTQPIREFPLPTQNDYNLGKIQRYFLSKTNEPQFIEVKKEQYQQYVDQDESVSYQLYQPFTFPWVISGDRNEVYNVNKRTLERTQQQQNIPGFKSYFKERYDQFYK